MPCLRRATSLAYTDADEDAERLLNFGDASGGAADEWVETHAGRKPTVDSAANPGEIDDIPDLDGDGEHELASAMGNVSISSTAGATVHETPDLDDIPDMEEEDLEEGEDEATAAPKAVASGDVIDARRVLFLLLSSHHATSAVLTSLSARSKLQKAISCKCGHTM